MVNSVIKTVDSLVQRGAQIADNIVNHPATKGIFSLFQKAALLSRKVDTISRHIANASACTTGISTEAQALYHRVRNGTSRAVGDLQAHLAHAPNEEAYFQLVAQEVSYHKWQVGDILQPSLEFNCPLYSVKELIHFEGGISGVVLHAENQPPIIAFRGTDTSNRNNLLDDLHEKIAHMNCTRYAHALAELLERVAIAHGRIHITGHSYGGAVAQRLTAKHPHLVLRCTFHNSPGVGKETADEYRRNIAQLPRDFPAPSIWSYRHAKDIVSLLGGDHLPVDHGKNFTASTKHDPTSYIEAHSANTISERKQLFIGKLTSHRLKQCAAFTESLRRRIGKIAQ